MNTFEKVNLQQGIDTLKALGAVWEDITNCHPQDIQDDKEPTYKKGDTVSLTFSNEYFIVEDVVFTHNSHLYLLARKLHQTERIISTESIIKK